MAAKKTATTATTKATKQTEPAQDTVTTPKYATLADVLRAKAKRALPRGSKFEVYGGHVRLMSGSQCLFIAPDDEVARWGLRRAGLIASAKS